MRRLPVSLATAVVAAAPLVAVAVTAGGTGAGGAALGRPLTGLVMPFGCAAPRSASVASCFGELRAVRRDGRVAPMVTSGPTGYGPADLQSAYKLAGASSGGATVAIVDAYDDPNAESDLATYRSTYNLPACTTANGCFRKIGQTGSSTALPSADDGWATEISLDLDMVSATCPDCHILLVEANSASDSDLLAAVDRAAATPGVVAISNSYGGAESSSTPSLDSHFDHPGIAITASSGDNGYGVSWPASSPYVTAVGGTSLTRAAGTARGWSETAWSGAGSGCSAYEPKPARQTDTGCSHRTVADVSAVADPNTGVAVYDTANNCAIASLCDTLLGLGVSQGADGWIQVGGTSASSPIIASVFALAHDGGSPDAPYAHPGALFDVTSGSNGSCGGSYLCTAGTGYDGPTGLGTPDGTAGF